MVELQDIVGQPGAIGQLRDYFAADRLPHAMLFAGPDGVGRRTTAVALAKLLLCENPQLGDGGLFVGGDATPAEKRTCGQCESCRMFDAESHPDYQPIYKELARFHDDAAVRSRVMQNLSIDVIRQFLLAPVARSPVQGRGKVFIVHEAELLSNPAQNAMLKTLEEPPLGVTIILLCERPDLMLPTTRSRCGLVRFGPLPHDFLTEKLQAAKIDAAEAAFWAGYTEGSLGQSIQLAKTGMYAVKCQMLCDLAAMPAGGNPKLAEQWAKTADTLAADAVKRAKKEDDANLSKTLAGRRATAAMLQLLASVYRDAMTLVAEVDRPCLHADQPREISAIAQRFAAAPTDLAEILEQLSRYERLLWRNVQNKLLWDNVAITCATAAPLTV